MTPVEVKSPRPGAPVALDMEAILAPLDGPSSAGPDLRDAPDGPFPVIEEARREDDDLDQGVWVHDRKSADWNQVVALCQEALASRTKDLRIAAWLAEALVHRDGFAGLAAGIELIEALCRAFWPGLHPLVDEDGDPSARVNALALLNSRLPRVLRTLPITRSGLAEPVMLSWGDYEMARLYASKAAGKSQEPSLAAFQSSAEATPLEYLERTRDAILAGLSAVEALDDLLDRTCGRDAPSLAALKDLLEEMAAWLRTTLPTPLPPEPAEEDFTPMSADDLPAAATLPAAGPITGRDEAYRKLGEIADYLMRTEPHSPTPYLLKRIHAWGHMPLHDLLTEIARGSNDLGIILDLLKPPTKTTMK